MKNKIVVAISILIVLIVTALILKQCNKPIPYIPVSIANETRIKDSFRVVIKYHDSTRIKTVTDHRVKVVTMLKDSTKCYTEIVEIAKSCETIIRADSVLIDALKGQHGNDSVIITKLSDKVLSDSLTIKKLNKRLKRQKLITKLAFWGGAILGGAGGYNVKP